MDGEAEGNPMSDLLKKAKALAALEAGIAPVTRFGLAYYAAQFQDRGPNLLPSMVPVSDDYNTATDALAAAADALGLTPDPSISGGVLTEEERESVLPTLLAVYELLHSDGVQKALHQATEHPEQLGFDADELLDVIAAYGGMRDEKVEALLNRLKGGA
jgi:hypothetical protein